MLVTFQFPPHNIIDDLVIIDEKDLIDKATYKFYVTTN